MLWHTYAADRDN